MLNLALCNHDSYLKSAKPQIEENSSVKNTLLVDLERLLCLPKLFGPMGQHRVAKGCFSSRQTGECCVCFANSPCSSGYPFIVFL